MMFAAKLIFAVAIAASIMIRPPLGIVPAVQAVEVPGNERVMQKEREGQKEKLAVPRGKHVDLTPVPGEKAPPIETEALDAVGEKIGHHIDVIGKKIAAFLGPWANATPFRGITWLKLLVVLSLILVVLVFERAFRAGLDSLVRKMQSEGKPASWKGLVIRALAPPISFFILVYGIYAALSPLFKHFQARSGANIFHDVAVNLANIGGAFALVWFIYRIIWAAGAFMQGRLPPSPGVLESILKRCRGPIQMFIMLLVIRSLLPVFGPVPQLFSILTNLLSLVFIGTLAWLAIQAIYVASDHFVVLYSGRARNLFYVRKVQTQVRFIRRLVVTLVILLSAAMGMMVFDKVRQLGTSILASAGIAGVIVGFAAQRTLANLLVGLQIAVTQPIRIGDIVTVENETGTIQEIYSTFAVIQTWDQRSLIIPLTYFTERTFQNLTLSSSELQGTVPFFVDYSVPVDAIREELHRILQASSFWDGRNWGLSVTNLKENSVELTAIMSASDSAKLGSLRSEVREKLLSFLQKDFPAGMPRVRAELDIGKGLGIGNGGARGNIGNTDAAA